MIAKSLYARLSLSLLGLLLLVGVSFIIISLYITEMYRQEVSQRLNQELARRIVAEKPLFRDHGVDEAALEEIFDALMVVNPKIEIYLLDPEGNILAFSAEPGKVKRKKLDLEPVKLFLGGETVLPLLGDDPRNLEGKKVFTAARIPEQGTLKGYLYVILGGELYDSVSQKLQGSYILRLGMWSIASSLAVAVVSGLIIFALLTRRLRRLRAAMGAYTDGASLDRLGLPAETEGGEGDEIDSLVSTFRHMAVRIEQQVDALKTADSLRRELVANASHDLRTPLATMQGYLETLMMKDADLSPEERRNYVETAINHCRRLNKLVSDLFELAKLEARDTAVYREPFNLNELVQDVVQKFQLRAEEKKVGIHANVGADVPFVDADIALMERVIENLLDNALRHTPEGGSVSVSFEHDGAGVLVRVSDTGCGIPRDELPRIMDRFYRLDRSRRDRTGHSGLGLAITRRILELHGSTIEVESEVGVGTTFSFRLPVQQSGR
ncbi:MAG: HAMP domain-containing sensor histidine kinase [Nitrospirota bacterium]|jgi:two-component system OmpR family sensor kinase